MSYRQELKNHFILCAAIHAAGTCSNGLPIVYTHFNNSTVQYIVYNTNGSSIQEKQESFMILNIQIYLEKNNQASQQASYCSSSSSSSLIVNSSKIALSALEGPTLIGQLNSSSSVPKDTKQP